MTSGTNPFAEAENEENVPVLYPRHHDPFVKRTKSVKKMRKNEKKIIKKQKHEEKKQKKKQKKIQKRDKGEKMLDSNGKVVQTNGNNVPIKNGNEETPDDNMNKPNKYPSERNANASFTLPTARSPDDESKPQEKLGYQTIDCRSPTEKEPPVLPNKRVLQLKAAGGVGPPRKPLKPDSSKKQTFFPSQLPSANDSPALVDRPKTLELAQKTQTLTTVPEEHRTPSPLVGSHHLNDDLTRIHRTGSVSKVNKEKSKKKKKLKMRLKKKKKSKSGKQLDVLEDEESMSQVVMRRKANELENIQRQVSETQEIIRTNVESLVHQRNSQLDTLLQASEKLDEASYGFAQVARDNRVKQQARTVCCGLGAKYRICWYICTCQKGVKKKKKKPLSTGSPDSVRLLSPRVAADLAGDTEDDCYKPASPPDKAQASNAATSSKPDRPVSASYSQNNRLSGSMTSLTNRLSQIPASIRGSMPSLTKKESPTLSGSKSRGGTPLPRRKSSSVSSVQDIIKKVSNKKEKEKERKEREKREQSYRLYVDSQFENEEMRGRAISLLRMDGSDAEDN